MPFRFTLAPVLRLRQSIQHQRTLQLQEANLQVSRAEETLAKLDRFLSDSAQSEANGLAAGVSAAELQFGSVLREKLQHFRLELQADVRKCEVARQKALGEYHQAYRERELLATLRDRQLEEYQQEKAHREQQELDSAYLLQRWHRRS